MRQAHPKWRDDLRLIGEGLVFVFVIALIVVAGSLA